MQALYAIFLCIYVTFYFACMSESGDFNIDFN